MSDRINTPFTAEHFVAFCLSMLGQPYWYGTCMFKCTTSLLNSKRRQYPSHYTSDRMSRYNSDISAGKTCADCVGACKGYAWNNGKKKSEVPDKSANGMFSYAKSKGCAWGSINTLPEVPGLALTKDGHVGYYIGGGYAVEWRGFAYGCVRTKVSGRPWTHWYALPFIDYNGAVQSAGKATEYTLGSRSLSKGSKGSDVKTMQEYLLKLGFSLPKYGADGDFGSETLAALKAFQNKYNLTPDGVYGSETHQALMKAVGDEETSASAKKVVIECSADIRVGNGTEYNIITTAENGAAFDWVATSENGWYAVVLNGQVGWVSGEYSKIE